MITGRWDHSTKPSTFIVKSGKEEIYRGPFKKGYTIFQEKRKIIGNDKMKKPKINIEDYAECEYRDCDYKASNGQTYHFAMYRSSYSVAWRCQITGEANGMCHHPDPHLTAAGAKKNGIKFVEAALKERGALNV